MIRTLIAILFFQMVASQTTPTKFHYTNVERTFVTLKWDAVSGVDGYRVYLDGVAVGTTTGTEYSISGLTTGNNYDMSVASYIGTSESPLSTLPNIRTGLYPDEEVLADVGYTPMSEPSNTTPYTNAFGNSERKVSQRSVLGDVRQLEKNYSKVPHWSRDGQEMRSDNTYEFYDANTYALKADRTVSNAWGWWIDNHSVRLNENKFQVRSADGATLTTLRTFTEYDNISIAPTTETKPDFTGDRWAFEGRKGTDVYLFTYEVSTDTKFGEVLIPDLGEGWTATSAYGNYAVVNTGNGVADKLIVYDFETLALLFENTDDLGHADLGVSIQGNEVMAGRINGKYRVYMLPNINDKWDIIASAGGDYFNMGHTSAVNFDQPGWMFLEDRTSGAYSTSLSPAERKTYRKVFSICIDENRRLESEALTRTYATLNFTESDSFVSSPDSSGEKVAFNNFGSVGTSWNEFYVAQRTTGENTTPPENGGEVPIVDNGNEVQFRAILLTN